MPKLTLGKSATDRIADKVATRLRPQYPGKVPGRDGDMGTRLVPVRITGAGSGPGYYEGVEQSWQDDVNNERFTDLSGGRTFTSAGVGELFCINYEWFNVTPNNGASGSSYANIIGRTFMAFARGGTGAGGDLQWFFMEPPRRALDLDLETNQVVFQYRKPMITDTSGPTTTYGSTANLAVSYSANSAHYVWIVGSYGGDFASLVLDASSTTLPSGNFGQKIGYIETDASNVVTSFQSQVDGQHGAFVFMLMPGGITSTRTVNNGTSNETWQLVNGCVVSIS